MSNEIAETILKQLGGQRFGVMVGAKNLVSHGPAPEFHKRGGLSFKIGSGAKDGITHVRVFLMSSDTYTVEFLKVRGANRRTVVESRNIYADQLRDTFTRNTGFDCSL